jgi:NADH:ubiquinone oxidoreductase subunit H
MTINLIYSFLNILVVLIPILLAIAFMTVLERKAMGEMQRRIGPNTTL